MKSLSSHASVQLAAACLAMLSLVLSGPTQAQTSGAEAEDDRGSYSYFRVVEGDATLYLGDAAPGQDSVQQAEIHRPILVGDRVEVEAGSRVEVVLSDLDLLRIDGDSAVSFLALAETPETEDLQTVLELHEGAMQVVVFGDGEGARYGEPTRIVTGNATVYLHDAGSYRLVADGAYRTRVAVRSGYAELLTDRGSSVVRSGEEGVLEGGRAGHVYVAEAGRLDALELWGEDLDLRAAGDYEPVEGLDEDLHYAAAPLYEHGDWVEVEHRRAWRPRVAVDWRPFHHGRWVYTPRGLTWVSYEPWGWVPYHYGTWDRVPGYGWVWFPSRGFSVAPVHWYWGSDYVAWFPSGYYYRHYGRRFGWSGGFSLHLTGWGGGHWDAYDDWFFCPTVYLGHRRQYRYVHHGRSLRQYTGWDEVPRGIITTDTRGLTPDNWRRSERVEEILRRKAFDDGDPGPNRRQTAAGPERELPDLRGYIAREPRISEETLKPALRESPRELLRRTGGKGDGATPTLSAQERRRQAVIESGRGSEGTPTVVTPTERSRREALGRQVPEATTRRPTVSSEGEKRRATATPRSDDSPRAEGKTPTETLGRTRESLRPSTPSTDGSSRDRGEVRRPERVTPREGIRTPSRPAPSRPSAERVETPTERETVRPSRETTSRRETPRAETPRSRRVEPRKDDSGSLRSRSSSRRTEPERTEPRRETSRPERVAPRRESPPPESSKETSRRERVAPRRESPPPESSKETSRRERVAPRRESPPPESQSSSRRTAPRRETSRPEKVTPKRDSGSLRNSSAPRRAEPRKAAPQRTAPQRTAPQRTAPRRETSRPERVAPRRSSGSTSRSPSRRETSRSTRSSSRSSSASSSSSRRSEPRREASRPQRKAPTRSTSSSRSSSSRREAARPQRKAPSRSTSASRSSSSRREASKPQRRAPTRSTSSSRSSSSRREASKPQRRAQPQKKQQRSSKRQRENRRQGRRDG